MATGGDRPYEMTSAEMDREIKRLRQVLAECRPVVAALAQTADSLDCDACQYDCGTGLARDCPPEQARALLKRLHSR